jgi:NTE family protein
MKIGLALSGGGARAAIFHFGMLRRLADESLLESVSVISTVSGGSLAAALVISRAGMQWPSSVQYRSEIFRSVRSTLTTTDLFSLKAIGFVGALKYNYLLATGRSRILADLLKKRWGIVGTLAELPDHPELLINTTCYETGKNWRFAKREMGDWKFGRNYNPPFDLADAAAASAAVPYVIGALRFDLPRDGWYRTNPATRQPEEKIAISRTSVRLWDGGAYENLGLEAVYKPQSPLRGCDYLMCSDASGPLGPAESASPLTLLKGQLVAPRLFDVSSDQIRALRSRMFVSDIENGAVRGALFRMGNSVRDIDIKARRKREKAHYDAFQPDDEVVAALAQPTGLSAVSPHIFDRIARHGYEVADATLTAYSTSEFPNSMHWREVE